MGAGYSSPSDILVAYKIYNKSNLPIESINIKFTVVRNVYESGSEEMGPIDTESVVFESFTEESGVLFNSNFTDQYVSEFNTMTIDYRFTLDPAYKFTFFDGRVSDNSIVYVPTTKSNTIIEGTGQVPFPLTFIGYANVVSLYYAVPTVFITFNLDVLLASTAFIAPIEVIIPTASEQLSQTVTKSDFALVESGLTLCDIELEKTKRLNEILNNIQSLRTYSRDTGSTTTYNNNGSLNQAGSRYTENFPSAKFANSVGINELLLNKKKYMFSNSLNKNVVSGPVAFNTLSSYNNTLPYNAGSSGLTKVQQFANAARGRTLSGGPGRRYGVQFYDGRSLVSIPNIYNQTNQTNQTINICAFV